MAIFTTETTIQRATGAAAIAMTVAPGGTWQLREIRVHLSAAGGAGNLTATIDSAAGTAYDAIVKTQDMTSVTDLEYQPTYPMTFGAGDILNIAWANASERTYGIEVVLSPVY